MTREAEGEVASWGDAEGGGRFQGAIFYQGLVLSGGFGFTGEDGPWGDIGLGVGNVAMATDITLGLTAFGISRFVEMPPEQFAWISIAGGAGTVLGTAATALMPEQTNLKSGVLIGGIVGLGAGIIATSFLEFEPVVDDSESGADGGGGESARNYSWLPEILAVMPSVQMGPGISSRHSDPRYADQMLVTLSGFYR